ncbi:hypothetical protein J4408_01515 [Candidatus Pacearchaeota archaeon]|nr:hypothetical protein [Candidatus Pacearchaeota archaeon]
MKIIESEETKEKRRKRNSKFITILLLFILLASTAGFAFSYNSLNDSTSGLNIEEGKAIYDESTQRWYLRLSGQDFVFYNSPDSMQDVQIDSTKVLGDYYGKTLYIQSSNELIFNEISSSLGRFSSRVQKACYGECEENLPIKTCTDNFIIINNSENNIIRQDNGCIFIDGNMETVDAFLYNTLGIN